MKSVTVNKTSTYYLQTTDTEITIAAGVLATVTVAPPIPYSINNKKTLTLLPAQTIVLKLSGKNWEISGDTQANKIPNLVSGQFLTNNGVSLLWKAVVSGVSSVFGRTGAVVAANGDYTAGQITNVPAGTVAAVTVQAAINELDTEKVPNTRTINTTSPLSGGGDLSANRTLTTSMNTNRLIGRGTAAVGVMEEITLGTNISLTGTTVNVSSMGGETLAQTLVLGNTTGANNIVVSAGQDIIIDDTASRVAGIGASKEVLSLDTATYPSLAELAFVKGLTSAAQTQINTKVTGTASALTKVDDTNVTLTLGGTPTIALLQATSLTLGWTGILASGRGGADAWVDYSASSTIVGWSVFTTKQILYQVGYKTITVLFYLQGTSNSTSTTFTLPTAMSAVEFMEMCRNNDNGTSGSGRFFIAASGSTVTFNQALNGGAWTAAGTKSIMGGFEYKID